MDAINRFTSIQKPVLSEESEIQAEPEQSAPQVASTGIACTPDGFENFQQPLLGLSSVTDPIAGTNQGTTPSETLEASSIFDVLNIDNGILPGDAVGKKLPPAAYIDIGPGDALGKKLPPLIDAPAKKLEPTLFNGNLRRLPLTEQHLNEFIQKSLTVGDQVAVTQDLKNWIKSNFRLTATQQSIVDSLSQADIQRAQRAAARAAELDKKISVEFRDPAVDQEFFVMNKDQEGELDTLQLEENNDSVVLKHLAGCKPEIISQMQEQLKAKTTLG